MGAVDALDCGEGGGIAGTTRTRMTRKRTPASSPTAAAATTAIARCSTAGGVATTTGGVGGGGQRKQPTREGSPDDNDGTIVGINGFARRLKQQSTNEGGTRGEMVMTTSGDDD